MLTKTQKKLYFSLVCSILLFVLPVTAVITYFVANRSNVVAKNNPKTVYGPVNTTDTLIKGTYPISFVKPSSEWNYRILSDNSNFGKINTMVFEIFKGDIVMRISIVEEDLKELRELERNGDQKSKVLDSVLEYQAIENRSLVKLNYNNLIRVNDNQNQIILSTFLSKQTNTGLSYLKSLDLFPEYTVRNKNSRLRVKITYLPNTEDNNLILDTIVPSLKLIEKKI